MKIAVQTARRVHHFRATAMRSSVLRTIRVVLYLNSVALVRHNGAVADLRDVPWRGSGKVPAAAVLFDLDDTLLDGAAAWRAGVARLCARCPGLEPIVALDAWQAAFDAHFDRFLAGETTAEVMRAGRIRTWSDLVAATVAE